MSRLFSSRVSLFVSLLWSGIGLAITVGATPTHAEVQHLSAEDVDQGQTYAAGTRLRIPKGTASFEIPSGWHAQRPEESETIILLSDAGEGFVMVFMMLNLTAEALTALLGERQSITHDLVFEPSGPVTTLGNRVMANYKSGSLSGQAISVMGPGQESVLFFLGSPPTDCDAPARVLEGLADSTQFGVAQ
jgi:hypothetical protein